MKKKYNSSASSRFQLTRCSKCLLFLFAASVFFMYIAYKNLCVDVNAVLLRNAMEQEYGIDISALRSADEIQQISMLDGMVKDAHGVRIAYVADDCGG